MLMRRVRTQRDPPERRRLHLRPDAQRFRGSSEREYRRQRSRRVLPVGAGGCDPRGSSGFRPAHSAGHGNGRGQHRRQHHSEHHGVGACPPRRFTTNSSRVVSSTTRSNASFNPAPRRLPRGRAFPPRFSSAASGSRAGSLHLWPRRSSVSTTSSGTRMRVYM